VVSSAEQLTNIIRVPPSEAHLEVVILIDDIAELVQQFLRLSRVELVYILGEGSQGVNALPTGDWIGRHNGMDGSQLLSSIGRVTPGFSVDIDMLRIPLGGFDEAITNKGGSQTLKELLILFRKAIIDLISRSPQGVSAAAGQLCQPERGVVGRKRLKLNVRVPLGRVVAASVRVAFDAEHLLARKRADGTDLGIRNAKLVGIVQHGMDMKRRLGWLSSQLSEAVHQSFLQVIREVVLGTKEDHTTLRD